MKEYYSGFVEGFSTELLDKNPLQIKVSNNLNKITPSKIYKLDEVDYDVVYEYHQLMLHVEGYFLDIAEIGVYEAIDLGVLGFSRELNTTNQSVLSNTKDSDTCQAIHLYYLVGRLN